MSKIEACIFDLDGVVVDTAKYHYKAWKRLGETLDFDFTLDDNEKLKGVSRMDSLNILLEIGGVKLSEEDKTKYATLKNTWYNEFVDKMTPAELMPGTITLFEGLKAQGYKIVLGSASKNAIKILDKLKITHWFDVIIDGTKTAKAKPDPQVFLLGAEGVNISPGKCVVFEDAVAGVEAALNAGMYCVGIGKSNVLFKAHKVVSGLDKVSVDMISNL